MRGPGGFLHERTGVLYSAFKHSNTNRDLRSKSVERTC
jgi:hypothetical protein